MQEISALVLATDRPITHSRLSNRSGGAVYNRLSICIRDRNQKTLAAPVEGDEARPCSRSLFEQGQCLCALASQCEFVEGPCFPDAQKEWSKHCKVQPPSDARTLGKGAVRWVISCILSLPTSIIFPVVDGWVHQLRKIFTVSLGSKSCEENKKR